MKVWKTAVNEKENEELMKIVKRNRTTRYAITKQALKRIMKENGAVSAIAWLLCYELIATTIVLTLL